MRYTTNFLFLTFVFGLSISVLAQNPQWSSPKSISGLRTRADAPRAAVSRDGTIYVVGAELYDANDNFKARLYMVTINRDSTTTGPIAITDPGHADWIPDVAVDTAGKPHVVWSDLFTGEVYYKDLNTQSITARINISQNSGGSFYPRIGFDHHNSVSVVWHDNSGGDYRTFYRSLDNNGWSPTLIISDSMPYASFPTLTIDSKDNLHVVWSSDQPPLGNRDIFYRSRISGSWMPIIRINSDTLVSVYPVIAIQDSSFPAILWQQLFQADVSPIIQKVFWSKFDGTQWSIPTPISELSEGKYPSVTVDNSGQIHASWFVFSRTGQEQRDSIFYSTYSQGAWTDPLNISGSIGYPVSAAPIILCDSNNQLALFWVSNNASEQAIYDAEIFYAKARLVTSTPNKDENHPSSLFSLFQNYPNPFNPLTTIQYQLAAGGHVQLKIYNVIGQLVAKLVDEKQNAGEKSIQFDASKIPSGVYFYKLQTDRYTAVKKMLLLR